jgi:lycopene cyclase domain-containing protein
MTYLGVLSIFILPPLLVMLILIPRQVWFWLIGKDSKPYLWPYWVVFLHVLIALIYTTPWDNYLVANGVWWYDPRLVVGMRIGWVPIEEYLFFMVQTLLTGLLTLALSRRFGVNSLNLSDGSASRKWGFLVIGLFWLASTFLFFSGWQPGIYLTLILSWALIPILLQVAFGMDILIANWRIALIAILPVTVYLWVVDSIALNSGTWVIDPAQTTGLKFGIIPIEEMVFFFLTNVIIAFGVILMLSPLSRLRLNLMIDYLRKKLLPVDTAGRGPNFRIIDLFKITTFVKDRQRTWIVSLGVWLIVLILTPIGMWIFGEEIFPWLVVPGVLANFACTILALHQTWSLRRISAVVLIVMSLSLLFEGIGVKTGLPFGSYAYSSIIQPQVANVPLMIPLAWMMMLPPAWGVSALIMHSWRKNSSNKFYRSRNWSERLFFAAIAGLAFTSWDFYLDPQMVGLGLWKWNQSGFYFGIPLVNFFGWWLASTIITIIVNPGDLGSRPLMIIYIVTWIFQAVGLGIFWNQPGPALIGFISMGIFISLALRKEGGIWPWLNGCWRDFSSARSLSP